MLKILRASAGAGKTYQLALEYIRLLVREEDPLAYRHVLAVTFTNKATEEMKSRILKELDTLAREPEKSKYLEKLLPECGGSVELLQERAKTQLSGILHDYSAFAVSTIDKFFQQTLRAFSREVGQFSSYQVQLDRDALVQESVDLVLDGLQESDRSLLNWLTEAARGDLSRTGKFSVDANLLNMAKSLKDLPEGAPSPSHGELRELSKQCKEVMEAFEKDVAAAADGIAAVFNAAGVDMAETSRGWVCAVLKYKNASSVVKPTAAFIATAQDSSKWFAKAKAHLLPALEGRLEGPLEAFIGLFGKRYKEYNTAKVIIGQIYGLGVADTLRKAFADVQKQNNVISIDDSNTILRGIIDGTDTPFIYEKLGVRFDDFLLDEFQDTSDVQWENFLPLIRGSESTGGSSLVVGDVKQSIYRWRGSDWGLLGSRIGQQFPRAVSSDLKGNYRTCRRIVEFNWHFFEYAADTLDGILGLDPASANSISTIYKGVKQEAGNSYVNRGSLFYVNYVKRFLDILISLILLLCLSPVLLILALLVRVKLGSPVIFRQDSSPGAGRDFRGVGRFPVCEGVRYREETGVTDVAGGKSVQSGKAFRRRLPGRGTWNRHSGELPFPAGPCGRAAQGPPGCGSRRVFRGDSLHPGLHGLPQGLDEYRREQSLRLPPQLEGRVAKDIVTIVRKFRAGDDHTQIQGAGVPVRDIPLCGEGDAVQGVRLLVRSGAGRQRPGGEGPGIFPREPGLRRIRFPV